jgi:DUF4097 and DUF4098 domain-containing protein YvlB
MAMLALLLAPVANANDGVDIKDTIKKTFSVKEGGTLSLDLDRGSIVIRSSSESTVLVEVERIVGAESKEDAKRILEHHQLEIVKKGNDVVVRSRFDQEGFEWTKWTDRDRVKLKVVVRVPAQYNVEFTTGAGNVYAEDVDGIVTGTTGAGNVQIGRVSGRVSITSGTGNVDIDGAMGPVEVATGAGNIRVGEVAGEVVANTGAGNIEAKIMRQPSSRSKLETGAGNVTVYLSDSVGIDVHAETGIGSADSDFGLKVSGRFLSGKSFKGSVNGGGPALTMHSGAGSVSLKKQ